LALPNSSAVSAESKLASGDNDKKCPPRMVEIRKTNPGPSGAGRDPREDGPGRRHELESRIRTD
jgi:hypothetical protein